MSLSDCCPRSSPTSRWSSDEQAGIRGCLPQIGRPRSAGRRSCFSTSSRGKRCPHQRRSIRTQPGRSNVHPRRALHHPCVPLAHWVRGSGYRHRDRRESHSLQHRRPRHEHSLLHRNRRRAGNNSRPTGRLPNPCSAGTFGCPGLLCLDAISHFLLRLRGGSQSRIRRHSARHCRRQFGRAWRHRDRTRTWGEGGRDDTVREEAIAPPRGRRKRSSPRGGRRPRRGHRPHHRWQRRAGRFRSCRRRVPRHLRRSPRT